MGWLLCCISCFKKGGSILSNSLVALFRPPELYSSDLALCFGEHLKGAISDVAFQLSLFPLLSAGFVCSPMVAEEADPRPLFPAGIVYPSSVCVKSTHPPTADRSTCQPPPHPLCLLTTTMVSMSASCYVLFLNCYVLTALTYWWSGQLIPGDSKVQHS